MTEKERIKDLEAREKELQEQVEEFTHEKDKLKGILGGIGGKGFSKRDNIINLVFLIVILLLFFMEMFTDLIPIFVSLEIGVLLVSIKIIFMIHNQHKVNHFQFWILNSIEYRVNEISQRLNKLEKQHGSQQKK